MQQEEGRPIPFIDIKFSINSKHFSFDINKECIPVFEKIQNKQVAVLSIAGPQRTGKSFLANRILKKMKGFAIGPTTMPCTKGIWIWSEPIDLDRDTVLLIIDTEGLYSVQRDLHIDLKIFSLSILLSSMFIYNQLGHIDEAAIEQLSLVLNLNENIRVNSQNHDISSVTPHFVWVLRDFSLDLDGMTDQEYLDSCLNGQRYDRRDREGQKKNMIRDKIKKCFAKRECITMVRPLGDETRLANIQDEDWDSLRPQFTEAVLEFEKKVFRDIKPKQFQGKLLNGEMYIKMVSEFLNVMNRNGIPEIESCLERVMASEYNKIFDILSKDFDINCNKYLGPNRLPQDTAEIDKMYNKLNMYINQTLDTKYHQFIDLSTKNKLKNQINEHMKNKLVDVMLLNEQLSKSQSNQYLNSFLNNFYVKQFDDLEMFNRDVDFLESKQQEFNELYNKYLKTAKGNYKYQSLCEKLPQMLFGFMEKQIEVIRKLYEQNERKQKVELKGFKSGEDRLRSTIEDYDKIIKQLQDDKKKLKSRIEDLMQENERNIDIYESQVEQYKQQIGVQFQGTDNEKIIEQQDQIFALKDELNQLRIQNQQKQIQNEQLIKKLEQNENTSQGDYQKQLVTLIEELKFGVKDFKQHQKKLKENGGFIQHYQKEIEQVYQQREKDLQKVKERESQRIQDLHLKYEKEQVIQQKKIEVLYNNNDELKVQLMDSQGKLETLNEKQNEIKLLQKENSQMNELMSHKNEHLQTHSSMIETQNDKIQKLQDYQMEIEQKLAISTSEKAYLYGYKDSLYDILKESLKFMQKKSNHLKTYVKNLHDNDRKDIQQCFKEVGVKVDL